jgi:bifunctional non-homologous end joining protein LigD
VIVPARRHRPSGFIIPCQPTLAPRIPTGPAWLHELKWDGFRIIARPGRLWSRNALDWANYFPLIAEAMGTLPGAAIDGEAVCLRADGRPDFHALRSKFACREAVFLAFDLIELDGDDLRASPLVERRAKLRALLHHHALRFSEEFENGEALFSHACRMGSKGSLANAARHGTNPAGVATGSRSNVPDTSACRCPFR